MRGRGLRALVCVLLLGVVCADDTEIAYLKSLLETLQLERAEALRAGDEDRAKRLMASIEETEYVLAQLTTQLVEPGSEPPPPPPPPQPAATPRSDPPPSRSLTLAEPYSGDARALLSRLEATGLHVVEPLPLRDLGEVRVSAGSYDSLALAQAMLTVAEVPFTVLQPGSIVLIRGE